MLKKIIILGLMLFIVCQFVSALDLTLGVKGGLNASGFYGEDYGEILDALSITVFGDSSYISYEPNLSYQVGGYLCLGVLDFLAIQAEAYYTRIGDLSKNDYGTFEDMADYLEFTALLKFRLQNKSTCFNAFAGPDFLWNITGKGNITVYDNDHNKRLSMDISEDSINRWLIGIAMGFGFDIDFTGIVLSFDVRYVAPLQEIYNNNLTYHDYVMENIQFLLGIGFKLF